MKINFLLFGGSLATFTSGTKGAPSFALSECSNGRTCVRNIQDCDPSTDSDCALVAFNVVGDKLNVTLTHSSKDTYVAVGFAPGTSMAKADITYCQYRSSGVGIVSAYSSRNGRPDDLSLVGYTSIQTAENNDVYECHFQKDRMMEKSGQKYNMDTNDYHVLLAKGNMNGNSPSYHGYGNKNRMATSKISFKAPVTQAPTSSPMASSSTLAQGSVSTLSMTNNEYGSYDVPLFFYIHSNYEIS